MNQEINNLAFDIMQGLLTPEQIFAKAKRIHDLSLNANWTPCAEGLPKESGRYIVTVKRTVLGKETEFTSERDFYVYLSAGHKWESTGIVDENIIAWMPKFKPAPYRTDDTTGKVKED